MYSHNLRCMYLISSYPCVVIIIFGTYINYFAEGGMGEQAGDDVMLRSLTSYREAPIL